MFGFDNITDNTSNGGFLRNAGIQMNASFGALTYIFSENWEGFDIELMTEDGKTFRERTFAPNIDKVFPKNKYADGKMIGTETMQEAYDRVSKEINTKVFHLANVFVPKEDLQKGVKNASTFKEFIDKVNKVMAMHGTDKKVNFLTMWKNSETKRRSNLIIADKIKWIEETRFNADGSVAPAKIALSKYQMEKNMTEQFPYNANNESTQTSSAIINNGGNDDLPF
jgi:hypothetical protein